MKHRSSQTLFAHWDAVRAGRDSPERAEISPGVLRGALGDTFILAFAPAQGHPFRLAGTRVCALFGRELRGQPFTQLWTEPERLRIASLLTTIADEAVGVIAGVRGRTAAGDALDLELLLLPLRLNGQTHQRLIGSFAASAAPYWVGARPLTGLTLADHRFIDETTRSPAPPLKLPPARVRRGLAVYDGGQA